LLYPDPFWSWRSSLRGNLDLFDPFDEFDQNLGQNFHWFFKPEFGSELTTFPRVPQRYRITVDCTGFNPDSIQFKLDEAKQNLTVTARDESEANSEEVGDFNLRRFRKTYKLPENSLPDQMISFVANNQLIIDVPLMETDLQPSTELVPQLEDASSGSGQKQYIMRFNVPADIDPNNVHINVKGHDVILRAEQKLDRPDRLSQSHFYQRTTFPEQANMDSLRCIRAGEHGNRITVTAPLETLNQQYKRVPIENWQQRQRIQPKTEQQQPKQTEM